jgi:hypothetical protein
MGDNFTIGNVTNANLNLKATLERVTQSIGTLPGADAAAQERLAELLNRLDEALKQAPQDQADEAAAVAELATDLVTKAKADKPNRGLLRISAEGLKQAAETLAGVVPAALTVAKEIVEVLGA